MIVKELIELLATVDQKASVQLVITNDEGLEGNKLIEDQNVFGFFDTDGPEPVLVISNREIDAP